VFTPNHSDEVRHDEILATAKNSKATPKRSGFCGKKTPKKETKQKNQKRNENSCLIATV
jgi:hypothetical protein